MSFSTGSLHYPSNTTMCFVVFWMVVCIFCILVPQEVCAQQDDRQLVLDMREAYQGLDYDKAEELAGKILARFEAFNVDELIETHVTLALIRYTQNRLDEAELQFISALSLKPSLELDPVLVSPKVRTFFDELKEGQFQGDQETDNLEGESPDASRYIFVRDPRPAAAIRSMILPGWGQFYKDEPVKGYVYAGLWAGSASLTIITHIRRRDAARSYRISRDPQEISDTYQDYNRLHKFRNAMFLTSASVWLVSYIDALLSGSTLDIYTSSDSYSLSLRPTAVYPYTEIRIAIRF